ncbi:hypothetical protein L6452_38540 [Arctium lappa]|uniref:Uncharacterized protein n=1 Tax=Arctium lappa TaxID=4217 RepID=A0ACB8XRL1_ARCLA|nr:hypothetical protein L6452_38540 [Arctium lappa]
MFSWKCMVRTSLPQAWHPADVCGKGKLGITYKATLELGLTIDVKRVKEMNSLSKKDFVQQMQRSWYFMNSSKMEAYSELLHVAHGNLKSSNVLIYFAGETVQAKLTNFGYLPLLQSRKSLERLAIGKCPEFVEGKKWTHKADVYCFGVLLLEVITGKVPRDNHEDLSDWVRGVVNADWSMDIFDLEILPDKDGHEDMLKLAELALECTDIAPDKRPKMTQVLIRLEEIHHPQLNIEEDLLQCLSVKEVRYCLHSPSHEYWILTTDHNDGGSFKNEFIANDRCVRQRAVVLAMGLISATILITYIVKYVSNSSASATKSSLTDCKRSIEPLGHNLQLDKLENSQIIRTTLR